MYSQIDSRCRIHYHNVTFNFKDDCCMDSTPVDQTKPCVKWHIMAFVAKVQQHSKNTNRRSSTVTTKYLISISYTVEIFNDISCWRDSESPSLRHTYKISLLHGAEVVTSVVWGGSFDLRTVKVSMVRSVHFKLKSTTCFQNWWCWKMINCCFTSNNSYVRKTS